MKQVLLFIIILTVCGSLTKPPTMLCGTQVKATYFLKGKITHYDVKAWQQEYGRMLKIDCSLHKRGLVTFSYDSAVYQIYSKPKK